MSSAMPLASVIIPTYNGEAFIREAVESALAQTYPNTEIIVVDDGSTDGTKKQIEDFIGDGRIKYVFQENAGPGVARNTGIKNTSGELIALLDHDDLWMPEKIEKQARFMQENPWADVVFCDGYGIDAKGGMRKGERERDPKKHSARPDFIDLVCNGPSPLPTAVMFKRQAIELSGNFAANKPGDWIADDWDMWFRMAAKGLKFTYMDDMLFKKRGHSANLTILIAETGVSARRTSSAFKLFMEGLPGKDMARIKKRLASNVFSAARKSMSLGNFRDGVAFCARAAGFHKKYYLKLPGLIVRYLRFTLKRKLSKAPANQ